MILADLAHGRAGDKGTTINVSVIAFDPRDYPWIAEVVTADRVREAVVEEVSVIRHMIGHTDWTPRRIAAVRTADGQRITVGLRDESEPGTAIVLSEEDGAPFGQAKA